MRISCRDEILRINCLGIVLEDIVNIKKKLRFIRIWVELYKCFNILFDYDYVLICLRG